MLTTWIRFTILSIMLIGLQVWAFSPISVLRLATPYVYPVLLLLMPIQTSRLWSVGIAFLIGSIIDMLGLTPGLHASALTLVGFLRYYFLKPMLEEGRYSPEAPAVYNELKWLSVALLVEILLVHHLVLFILDAGQYFDWLFLAKRMLYSFAYSFILSLLIILFYSIRIFSRTTSDGK